MFLLSQSHLAIPSRRQAEFQLLAIAQAGSSHRHGQREPFAVPAAWSHSIGQRVEQRSGCGDPETEPFAVVKERNGAEIDLDGGENKTNARHGRAFRECSYPPGLSRGPPGRFLIRATLEHGVGVRPVGAVL